MDNNLTTPIYTAHVKRAELLSSLGAGILGAGIALLLANLLVSYAVPILLLGLVSHVVGMSQKHGLEQQARTTRIWWAEALYWLCWLALFTLLLLIIVRQF